MKISTYFRLWASEEYISFTTTLIDFFPCKFALKSALVLFQVYSNGAKCSAHDWYGIFSD